METDWRGAQLRRHEPAVDLLRDLEYALDCIEGFQERIGVERVSTAARLDHHLDH